MKVTMIKPIVGVLLFLICIVAAPASSSQQMPNGGYLPNLTNLTTQPAAIWGLDGSTPCFIGGPDLNCVVPIAGQATGNNVSVTPTIQAAQYVSGNCMGGFQTVSLGTSQSILSQVMLSSKGGLATAKQIYVFSANPTSSTCTDKGTFTLAAADISKLMTVQSITPSAPVGTTVTQGAASSLALGISSGGVVYVGIVETTTETPASTSDLVLNFSSF